MENIGLKQNYLKEVTWLVPWYLERSVVFGDDYGTASKVNSSHDQLLNAVPW